ncbi:hypothetical protein ACFQY5_35210 [Paeniroseomonas aquatica]
MTFSPKARNAALFTAVAAACLILPDLAHAQVGAAPVPSPA